MSARATQRGYSQALDTATQLGGPVVLISPITTVPWEEPYLRAPGSASCVFLDDTIRLTSLFQQPARYGTVNTADSSAEISVIREPARAASHACLECVSPHCESEAHGLCHQVLQDLRQAGQLSALNSTTVKMGLITPAYYVPGKRATANEYLRGALKMKKVPGC